MCTCVHWLKGKRRQLSVATARVSRCGEISRILWSAHPACAREQRNSSFLSVFCDPSTFRREPARA